nr:T9SS type A sorting domain-containing protein [Flavisolibacter sp.]
GRTYYYSIRAKTAGTIYSSFSNVATGAPYVYSVYINFNQTNPAGSPWNNTNAAPQEGLELNALKDATGQATSLSLVQSSSWSGIYPGGVDNTGNTGIFPDAVMKESFGLFPGVSGKIRIRGLNMSMKYNLSFFASAAITGDVNVAYTVGSKTVMLNTALNRSGLVTMYDVSADANGEINITVAPGTGTSQFGLLGALIIEGYHPSAAIAPLPAGKQQEATVALSGNQGVKMLQLNVHPNPFQQSFVLSVETGIQEVLDIAMYDMSGKMIHQQQYRHLRAGWNPIRIQPSNGLPRGVYLIKVTTADGNTGSLRVIKN